MPEDDRLDSWKEIAAFLGREVRTVQGWEKSEGLPVHRHQHARQGSVYAFKSELDAWREARKGVPPPAAKPGRLSVILVCAGVAALAVGGIFLWKNRRPNPSADTPSSVVVLPFADFSPQKDQEYFSDGLTEEIIDALSRVPNLHVVARTSAFAFKGKPVDVRQIGKQLNVNTVLEGSVRKSGDSLRITAQLNRVSDGYHLWSRTYDRQLRDVFAVQQEISQSIASQLRAGDVPRRTPTANLEAYARYQEGRYFFNQHLPPESYFKAIERYQQAIQLDPKFALAYSGVADAYVYLAENAGMAPREVMPKAKEAAAMAVELDDNLAEAHTSVAIVKLDYDWDWEGAQRELARAMQLNPGSDWVHHWVAHSLEAQGRLDEAMKEMRTALDLDPLSIVYYWDLGNELLLAQRYDEALQDFQKADELFPNFPVVAFLRAEAYVHKGDLPSAHRVFDAVRAAHPEMAEEPMFLGMTGALAARDGRRAEAQKILDQLEQLHKTRYVEPIMTFELCTLLGDHQRLMQWLNRAHDEHSTFFVYLPLMKIYFGGDPEVEAFLRKNR